MIADLEDELGAWCASYVAAFSAYDVEGISGHWMFPALIIQAERNIVFRDRDRFDANTAGLLGFYKAQRVQRAIRELKDCLLMTEGVASMRVADVMVDAGGVEIASWEAAYTLRRTGDGWRAVLAAADGEVAAWAARGTPLCG